MIKQQKKSKRKRKMSDMSNNESLLTSSPSSINCVYSPVNGFIDKIDTYNNDYYRIFIYITRQSDHRIYIPLTGVLSEPKLSGGNIIIDDPVFKIKTLFKQYIDTRHTAEITWEMHPAHNTNAKIYFTIQVGKPQFITDKIRLDIQSVNTVHNAKKQLGEILLGSRAIIYLSKKYYKLNTSTLNVYNKGYIAEQLEIIRMNNNNKDDIIAGETILACP